MQVLEYYKLIESVLIPSIIATNYWRKILEY